MTWSSRSRLSLGTVPALAPRVAGCCIAPVVRNSLQLEPDSAPATVPLRDGEAAGAVEADQVLAEIRMRGHQQTAVGGRLRGRSSSNSGWTWHRTAAAAQLQSSASRRRDDCCWAVAIVRTAEWRTSRTAALRGARPNAFRPRLAGKPEQQPAVARALLAGSAGLAGTLATTARLQARAPKAAAPGSHRPSRLVGCRRPAIAFVVLPRGGAPSQ
jgi:hypothetical protein